MRAPIEEAQRNVLDAAGALLAQSTAALAQSVHDAAGGAAEILLLAHAYQAATDHHLQHPPL